MDKRMVKTKKAIRTAFAELSKEKELHQITVTDIAKKADINRKTFYAHYGCVEDILTEMEDEFVRLFEKDIEKLDLVNAEHPLVLFTCLSKKIESDIGLYRMLFEGGASQAFSRKLVDMLVEKSNEMFKGTPMTAEQLEIMSCFTIAGSNYVYQRWFAKYPERSLDELSKDIGILMMQGINGYKKEKNG